MSRYSATERIGVNAVEQLVLNELEWIFREQPIVDVGIDAHIERVDDGAPTGKLIALQIKTGPSHFRDSESALTYYGTNSHLDYWTSHSLPVLLVAHLPKTSETYWVAIEQETVERTEKGWKVRIPKSNVLERTCIEQLCELFDGAPSQQKFRKLSIDQPLMQHIARGGKVSVELEDWINKSLGRTPVRVFICDENGAETLSQDWFQLYVGYGIKDLTEALFPWATAVVDEDFYEANSELEDDWQDELSRAPARDNGIGTPERDPTQVYPYAEAAGEIECYRLELRLNDLGRAFLKVSSHLSDVG